MNDDSLAILDHATTIGRKPRGRGRPPTLIQQLLIANKSRAFTLHEICDLTNLPEDYARTSITSAVSNRRGIVKLEDGRYQHDNGGWVITGAHPQTTERVRSGMPEERKTIGNWQESLEAMQACRRKELACE